jgi:hypothetical protein
LQSSASRSPPLRNIFFVCAIFGPQPSGWRDQVTAFIRRREFITLLGTAAAAWPLAAHAQFERVRRIGVLTNLAADDPEGQVRNTAFAQALAQLGGP